MLFEDKNFIAKKIKYSRRKNMLTQERLAEMIGISAKQLSRIENGDYIPSLPTFLKIVIALNLNMDEFGIDLKSTENPIKDDFIKFVYTLSDKEVKFYYNIVKNISENINIIK